MSSKWSPSEIVKGAGTWASGTTVREIEGHFNRSNEPKDVRPISQTGGVPGVDFKDKIKNAVTGYGDHDASSSQKVSSAGGIGSRDAHAGSASATTGDVSRDTAAAANHHSGPTGTGLAAAAGTTGPVAAGVGSATTGSSGPATTGASLPAPHTEHKTDVTGSSAHGHGKGHEHESLVDKVKNVVTGHATESNDAHGSSVGKTVPHTSDKDVPAASTTGAAAAAPAAAVAAGHASRATTATGTSAGAALPTAHGVGNTASTLGAGSPSSPTRTSATSGLATELRQAAQTGHQSGGGSASSAIPANATTGTTATSTAGATHGISDSAERTLKSENRNSVSGTASQHRTDTAGYATKEATASNTNTPEKKKDGFFAKVKEALS